jgi:hypothetical protein
MNKLLSFPLMPSTIGTMVLRAPASTLMMSYYILNWVDGIVPSDGNRMINGRKPHHLHLHLWCFFDEMISLIDIILPFMASYYQSWHASGAVNYQHHGIICTSINTCDVLLGDDLWATSMSSHKRPLDGKERHDEWTSFVQAMESTCRRPAACWVW